MKLVTSTLILWWLVTGTATAQSGFVCGFTQLQTYQQQHDPQLRQRMSQAEIDVHSGSADRGAQRLQPRYTLFP